MCGHSVNDPCTLGRCSAQTRPSRHVDGDDLVACVTCALSTSCHPSLCATGLVLRLYETTTTTFDCSDHENNKRNEGPPTSAQDCCQPIEVPIIGKTKGSQFCTFAALLAEADRRELSDIQSTNDGSNERLSHLSSAHTCGDTAGSGDLSSII
jgi:hypothetical protein